MAERTCAIDGCDKPTRSGKAEWCSTHYMRWYKTGTTDLLSGPALNGLRHGHTREGGMSPTYNSWANMVQRTTNPNRREYPRYGGRGITVAGRWLGRGGFAGFLADMGERPAGTTLDRINPDGNYQPGNVRWATRQQQYEAGHWRGRKPSQ